MMTDDQDNVRSGPQIRMATDDPDNMRSGPVDVDDFIKNWWEEAQGEGQQHDMRDRAIAPVVSFGAITSVINFGAIRRNRLLVGGIGILAIVLIAIIATSASGNQQSQPPEVATIAEEDQELFSMLETDMNSKNISTVDLLRTNAHQYKAFTWLTENANLTVYDDSKKIQRFALACLYYATYQVANEYTETLEPWFQAESWVTDADECEWAGIRCDSENQVHSITLVKNKMSGRLPMELALLKHSLKGLELTSNQIFIEGDDLELFSHLTKLEKLSLDDNYLLTGDGLPSSLMACTDLQKLVLSYNMMEGPLDNGVLTNLTKLIHVEIENNLLTGTIPDLGALQGLVYLYLRHNTLSSNLNFVKTSNHKNLASLWLDGNDISQTIPTEIGLIKSLTSISIADAQLTGSIPTELGHLTNLQLLWLFNNQLTGKIPTELAELENLEALKIEDNSVKGHMPSGLCTIFEQAVDQDKVLSFDCEHVKCDCCSTCNLTARIEDP